MMIAIVVVTGLFVGGYGWGRHAQRYPTTNDAYIGAHVVRIASEVDGRLSQLPVKAHTRVKQGQLLLALDPSSYEIAVNRAAANDTLAKRTRTAAQAAVASARAGITEQQAKYDQKGVGDK